MKQFPDFVTNDIVEILYNLIKGVIPMKQLHVTKLRKFQKQLLTLTNLPNPKGRQTYVYKQKGNFIGALLPIIASLIGGIVSNVV